MRMTIMGLLTGSVLVAGCSCGARPDDGALATDTDTDTDTDTEDTQTDSSPPKPCPHVYFGEVEAQPSLGGGAAQAAVAADFDGDGLLDLAATLEGGDIAILRNRGRLEHLGPNRKTFDAPVHLRRANAGLGVMDWNGDGRPDLVAVRRNWSVGLFENRGDFQFEQVREERIPLETVGDAVAIVDMDGDGREDIVVYGGRGMVIWPAPDKHGALGEPFALELGPLGLRRGDIADLDGDGVPDLAVAGFSGDPFLVVAFGDGRGGLERVTPYTRSDRVRGFEAAIVDIDGDGVLDVLVVGSTWEEDPRDAFDRRPRFLWMRGTGDGALEEAAVLEPSPGLVGWTVAHADLARDGSPEFVALANGAVRENADPIEGAFHLLSYRNGSLSVAAPGFIEAGTTWGRILLQDMDGDGFEDFVRVTGGVSVRWGCPR
jgi:hypothetical protein